MYKAASIVVFDYLDEECASSPCRIVAPSSNRARPQVRNFILCCVFTENQNDELVSHGEKGRAISN